MKVALTVLGSDKPGIVCLVSSILAQNGCNIEAISQAVLYDEFAGIFLISIPLGITLEDLETALKKELSREDLGFYLKPVEKKRADEDACITATEPFVVISVGKDRVGLIAALSCVMKEFGINITNLRFVSTIPSFPNRTVTIYEVDIPNSVDLALFTHKLQQRAASLELEVSVQHKKIFEDICRI